MEAPLTSRSTHQATDHHDIGIMMTTARDSRSARLVTISHATRRSGMLTPSAEPFSGAANTAGIQSRASRWQAASRAWWRGCFRAGRTLEDWKWRGHSETYDSDGTWYPISLADGRFGTVLRQSVVVAFWTITWYLCSLSLTASNKLVFVSLGFPYPLAVTFANFAGCALISRAVALYCVPTGSTGGVSVDPRTYLTAIVPISVCCAAEVALTNQAISMVSLSVITVVKSTLVAATYAVAIMAGLERLHHGLALVLFWIIASVALSVPGMEIDQPLGLVLLGLAVLLAAIRWVLVHKQLSFTSISSLDLIAITQPLAALCLLPASLLYDAPDMIETIVWGPADSPHSVAVVSLIAVGVLFACMLLFAEFRLIEATSSLTLTVAGVGKECLTIAMSTVVFKETLQLRALIGLMSSIAGITAYAYVRSRMQTGAPTDADRSVAVNAVSVAGGEEIVNDLELELGAISSSGGGSARRLCVQSGTPPFPPRPTAISDLASDTDCHRPPSPVMLVSAAPLSTTIKLKPGYGPAPTVLGQPVLATTATTTSDIGGGGAILFPMSPLRDSSMETTAPP